MPRRSGRTAKMINALIEGFFASRAQEYLHLIAHTREYARALKRRAMAVMRAQECTPTEVGLFDRMVRTYAADHVRHGIDGPTWRGVVFVEYVDHHAYEVRRGRLVEDPGALRDRSAELADGGAHAP